MGVAGILVVPGLKCERSMDEVEIDITQLESLEARLERRPNALGTMVGVPQLRCDEEVIPSDRASGEHLLERIANFALVPVSFRTIEMPEAGFQRISGGVPGRGGVGDQGPETECGNLTSIAT
jgi:hypothetical protein